MAGNLESVLSSSGFQPEKYVKEIAQGGDTAEDLFHAKKQVQIIADETSKSLKNNVYRNYTQFIDTAREISYLEQEMYQLSHQLTEQKTLISTLSEMSITSEKVESKKDEAEESKEEQEHKTPQHGLMRILEKVEGCSSITEVPGRTLVHEGDLVELDTDSLAPLQRVHAFLLNDCLMIANWMTTRRGPLRYKFQSLYVLDESLAVVNVRDVGSAKNAFKILKFPNAHLYQCDSPKAKKTWYDKLEETKKAKLHKATAQKKELTPEAASPFMEKPPINPFGDEEDEISQPVDEAPDLLESDWLKEVPDDLDVCIAQRDFDGAVDLIDKTNEHLEKCPRTPALKEYRLKLDVRLKQLGEVLIQELRVSAGTKLQGGPRAARRAVRHLIRLGKSAQASNLFLKQRSSILRHSMQGMKFDQGAAVAFIKRLCNIFFNNVQSTITDFTKAFARSTGCYSALTVWCISEFDYFMVTFNKETFTGENTMSAMAECIDVTHKHCVELQDQGVDLTYGFYSLITDHENGVLLRSKEKLMEANKRSAVEDTWKPMDLQDKPSLDKFLTEMSNIGVASIHAFVYDDVCISLTKNTVQFSKSYLVYMDDVLKMYQRMNHAAVVRCLTDLLKAQLLYIEASLKSEKYAKEHKFILKNAHFLLETVLTLAERRFEQSVGHPCDKLAHMHREMSRLKGVAKHTTVAYV
ncbi:PREDICTED: exocyst complex component 8-like [Priapulus caudatus]|uniref:Exocyst complex component 8 n=1 Tax=Priapulus caudatus TaxID=37621 RepID=A0ABM1DX15_PRICU|nr:PREDICTED: exocyst complex component 8-like [Priapulus caudatus]